MLDDFEAEAFEGGDVHGRVGEQADALNAQIGEDLAAEADGAQDAAGAGLGAFAGAQFLMEDEAAGLLRASARRGRRSPRGRRPSGAACGRSRSRARCCGGRG